MIPGVVASQISVTFGTVWTYLGTSGSYDDTYSYVTGSTCDSESTTKSKLTTERPPSNYPVGTQMRVTHSTNEPLPCTTRFYRCD